MQGMQKKWIIAAAAGLLSIAVVATIVATSGDKDVVEPVSAAAQVWSEETVTSVETVKPVEQSVEEATPVVAPEPVKPEPVVAEVVEEVKPVKPETEIAEVAEVVEEIKPVKPAVAVAPAKVQTPPPAEPPKVEEPVKSVEPVKPVEPAKPVVKVAPVAPPAKPKVNEVVVVEEEVTPVELTVEPHQKASRDVVAEAAPVVIAAPEEVQEPAETAVDSEKTWLAGPVAEPLDIKPVNRSVTLDGVAGGFLTQTAYLLNPKPVYAKTFGKPTVSARFTSIGGDKDIETISISETLWGRVELGYTISRLGLGNFNSAAKKAGFRGLGRDDVWLHVFNLRGMLLEETKYLPAVTAGVQFRINDGIDSDNFGVDYTLFASKTFGVANRPLTLSGGMRITQAREMGYFGFDNSYHAAFEGSVSYQLADWLVMGYEIRQNPDTFRDIKGVIEREDIWQAITANFLLGENLSVQAAYGMLGKFANSSANDTWSIQLMYKF